MIEFLASKRERRDEVPNIELAERLCTAADSKGLREIVAGLRSKEEGVASDCIKVLYEVGRRKPDLIAGYANDLLDLLASKDNRLVWGGMMALSFIATLKADTLFARLPEIVAAYKKGSVITVDNAISVLAGICVAGGEYHRAVFPLLLEHFANCRGKEIPQHAERVAVCINDANKAAFAGAVAPRMKEMSEGQKSRVTKLLKKL